MARLSDIFDRQGVAIPKTREEWEQYDKLREERRTRNMTAAREVLPRNEIPYTEIDSGVFRIDYEYHLIHYTPASGQWKDLSSTPIHIGYGIRNLVKYLKGNVV